MVDHIIATYCLCADSLIALRHHDDLQCKMSDAEVLTTALVSARFFRGNLQAARGYLKSHGFIPRMLSLGRFLRRLYRAQHLLVLLVRSLGNVFKQLNLSSTYIIDTFPIQACDNIRIPRNKLLKEEKYRGYCASKRRYFYGVKIVVLCTAQGEPVEVFLMPGSVGDVSALRVLDFDLPKGSVVYCDSAFTEYETEDLLGEVLGIKLSPMRKKNSKRKEEPWIAYLQAVGRKRVETLGSMVERLLPKSIHAVTAQGFLLKVFLFVAAVSLDALF